MHASIESSGGGGPSTIDIPRPFPNDPSLFKDWADFFRQAQAKSQPVVGPGVLHYPDWNTEAGVEDGNTLCSVCRQPGFAVKKAGVDHTSLPQTWAVSYPTWQGHPVNCTGKCLAVPPGRPASLAAPPPAKKCSGGISNGTRPGADYASIKMNGTSPSAAGCREICCKDEKCVTWVFVSAAATKTYPKRARTPASPPSVQCLLGLTAVLRLVPGPQEAYCWLKAKPIALKGTACDNGHPGCLSGVVNRTK